MLPKIRRPLTALATFLAGTVLMTANAQAEQLRFTTTAPGGIASTGNTLGLSKAFNDNAPGTEDSIGTFISLDGSSVDGSYPMGTTSDWTQNGSEATLGLVPGAEVLYAELVWAGSYYPEGAVVDFLDSDVALSSGGETVMVTPAGQTTQNFTSSFAANYYIRSADVTAFVKKHGAASYAVSGVPATADDLINSLHASGWSLVVAYRGEDQPIRNLSVFVGGSFVDEESSQDYTYSGFCAPPFGPVEGKVVVSALEGDADLTGDMLAISSDGNTFESLDGLNNPATNFFASQINGGDELLDMSGSFGDANHDAFNGINVAGGRQGWDLTTIALSDSMGQLSNNQTSAVLRTETSGDSYVPTLMALELDVKSPDFSDSGTTASPQIVQDGDVITVDTTLNNSGEAVAADMRFVLPLDPNLQLVSFEMDDQPGDVNGDPVTAQDLAQGIPAGNLPVGTMVGVSMTFEVLGEPQNGSTFNFNPTWEHNFVVCEGDPAIPESHSPPTAIVAYDAPMMDPGVGGGDASTSTTTGGGEGGSGAGGPVFDTAPIEEDGGCGCATPGQKDTPAWPAALGLAFVGLVGARRRRRG